MGNGGRNYTKYSRKSTIGRISVITYCIVILWLNKMGIHRNVFISCDPNNGRSKTTIFLKTKSFSVSTSSHNDNKFDKKLFYGEKYLRFWNITNFILIQTKEHEFLTVQGWSLIRTNLSYVQGKIKYVINEKHPEIVTNKGVFPVKCLN